MHHNIIEILSKNIAKLPGMGPRIAKRIVLYLANNKEKILLPLIKALQQLNEKINHCQICDNLDEGITCQICLDSNRDDSIICVVEEVGDLWAIERTNEKSKNFRGKYHILGGNLSASAGQSIEDLNFPKLLNRLKDDVVKEVIIATSATIDGQTTAHFLAEILKDYKVKVSRLAHGIPVGSELDYLDEGTISIAMKTRSEML
jgi:recombination protein RecR